MYKHAANPDQRNIMVCYIYMCKHKVLKSDVVLHGYSPLSCVGESFSGSSWQSPPHGPVQHAITLFCKEASCSAGMSMWLLPVRIWPSYTPVSLLNVLLWATEQGIYDINGIAGFYTGILGGRWGGRSCRSKKKKKHRQVYSGDTYVGCLNTKYLHYFVNIFC